MKLLPFLALLLTTVLAVRADVVIEQKIESAQLNGNMTMKIKGDQARMDTPSPAGQATTIMNTKTGDMTTLIHSQKMAVKMNMNAMKQQAGLDPSKLEKPKATGVTEKVVANETAEIYEFEVQPNGISGKAWVATKGFSANYEAFRDAVRRSSSAAELAGAWIDFRQQHGLARDGVVKTQMNIPGMGALASDALISAKQAPVADTELQIPERLYGDERNADASQRRSEVGEGAESHTAYLRHVPRRGPSLPPSASVGPGRYAVLLFPGAPVHLDVQVEPRLGTLHQELLHLT